MKVLGEWQIAKFSKRYAQSRKPLQRFLEIAREAEWIHFPDIRTTFPATDFVNGTLIFDIGGNKYRLIASVDFDAQIMVIEEVLTHKEYDERSF